MEPFYTKYGIPFGPGAEPFLLPFSETLISSFVGEVSFEGAEWISRSLQIRRMFICHTHDVGICFFGIKFSSFFFFLNCTVQCSPPEIISLDN